MGRPMNYGRLNQRDLVRERPPRHDLNSAQIAESARVVEERAPTEGRVRLSEESVHRVVAVLRTVLSGSHALNHQIVHQAASNVEIDHSQVQENFLKNVRVIINKYDLW